MPDYIDRCKKCSHFQVCANVMKNQLFIREKMLLEENPECEHFISAEDVVGVVRCKDCIHRDKAGLCQAEGQKLTIVKDNHFCGKGERKDGNEECLNS